MLFSPRKYGKIEIDTDPQIVTENHLGSSTMGRVYQYGLRRQDSQERWMMASFEGGSQTPNYERTMLFIDGGGARVDGLAVGGEGATHYGLCDMPPPSSGTSRWPASARVSPLHWIKVDWMRRTASPS